MKRKAMNRIAYVEVQKQGELFDRFGKAIVPFPDWRNRIKSRAPEFYRYLETMMVGSTLPKGKGLRKPREEG